MNCCEAKITEELDSEILIPLIPCLFPPIPPVYATLLEALRALGLPLLQKKLSDPCFYLKELDCYYCGDWLHSQYFSTALFYFPERENSSLKLILTEFNEQAQPS